jgi:Skp family chaperone for outer membrane proteins
MEIRIGIQDSARDLAIESEEARSEILEKINSAISGGELLSLTDAKGRTIIVDAKKISFVEIGPAHVGQVGFAQS